MRVVHTNESRMIERLAFINVNGHHFLSLNALVEARLHENTLYCVHLRRKSLLGVVKHGRLYVSNIDYTEMLPDVEDLIYELVDDGTLSVYEILEFCEL